MEFLKAGCALALLLVMAGCGGSGGGSGTGDPPELPPILIPDVVYTPATRVYWRDYDRAVGLRNNYGIDYQYFSPGPMPYLRQAQFDGHTVIRVPTGDSLTLLGRLRVETDFRGVTADNPSGEPRVSGQATGFHSMRAGATQAEAWDGAIILTTPTGGIDMARPLPVHLDAAGVLTSGGNAVEVAGGMQGLFMQDSLHGGYIISATLREGGLIRYNGTDFTASGLVLHADGATDHPRNLPFSPEDARSGMTILGESLP